ncbi:uncharacterized protein EV420DRAFT_1274087 [Desarmillaria tabescens]|uniref:Peptidase C14 caspase domain-containing protein n=1 Tax=Armillaria tabescens TaxID=1929756 RepID=A0AA39JYV7_ARMTA|nr:uncharacterized protein EV420DRAFT_1274087 [Desarmillaria tabescens]KAK0451364.1 hypothetical protein EV420DRAFT_1274087 [Desarmillaria tabescens]
MAEIIPHGRQNYHIFALVIGIDEYKCTKYDNLEGAASDADEFKTYLLEDLRTPKANIISLRDRQATRSAIIGEFIKMKDNAKIQQDKAAIIIYFAGYGATTTAPVAWADWEALGDEVKMLCPTDIGDIDENGDIINGIPHRTINQLLLELSAVKGNNIVRSTPLNHIHATLILDCCHAAGQSNKRKPAIARNISNPPRLFSSCDQEIHSRQTHSASGITSSPLGSHVLIAACNRRQSAYEEQGKGIFTCALLKVLREWKIGQLTYKSLIHRLDMPQYLTTCPSQTPRAEGKYITQPLFNSRRNTAVSSRILCHHEKEQPHLSLCAGSFHGIVAGSIFEIYRTDVCDKERPLTTATAETVEAFVSFLRPVDQTIFTTYRKHRVWYAYCIRVPTPIFTIYCNDSSFLAQVLTGEAGSELMVSPSTVDDPEQADLCLTVDGDIVFFDRGNRTSLVRSSIGLPSRFSHTSRVHAIANIRNIIDCYAHFTSQVIMSSPLPISTFVSIEMKEVESDRDPIGNNLLHDAEDEPVEVVSIPFLPLERLGRHYEFIAHNTSAVKIYVNLLHFNVSTLKISEFAFTIDISQ